MHTLFLCPPAHPPTPPPTHSRTTAGIGENSAPMRREFCRDMQFAGVQLDNAKNEGAPRGTEADVSADGSKVKVGGWAGCLEACRPKFGCAAASYARALPPRHCCRPPPTPALPLAPVQVLVIPTDEELSIAQQTVEVIDNARGVAARA